MFVDLRSLDEGATVEADLCVVGAGAAGITLARAFAGRSLRVCLVESGGFEREPAIQDLYRGQSIGTSGFPLHVSRLRWLGGTTNHWNGWCAPLDATDLAPRPWIARSGWPFGLAELAPHYEGAARLLGLGRIRFDAGDWDPAAQPLPPLDAERVRVAAWRIDVPPTRFGTAFRGELAAASNVTVLHHASVVRLARRRERASLGHVDVAALEGRRARVRARLYVLACGGIENARLLLASDDVETAGLGNGHDRVGRCYMDHFQTVLGRVHAPGPALRGLRRGSGPGPAPLLPALRLAEAVQREARVANSVAYVGIPRPSDAGAEQGDPEDPGWLDRVARMLDDLFGEESTPAAETDPRRPRDVLRSFGNPVPDPDSRVRLGTERDALGMRRLVLDWRLGEADRRGIEVLARTVGAELARLGAGRLRLAPWLRDGAPASDWTAHVLGANHSTGTTRMAASPREGVTDPAGRVHGLEDLYVAGSSVFPTAGWANPTLTILALTLRLADHLGRRLGVAPVRPGPAAD